MDYNIISDYKSINNFNSIVVDRLENLNISFELVEWNGTIKDDKLLNSVFKTLVLKSKDNTIVVFGIPVHKKLNYSLASSKLNLKRLKFIDNLEELTGMKPKACSLLVLEKFKIVLDSSFKNNEYIFISSANANISVKIKTEDLKTIISFCDLNIAI